MSLFNACNDRKRVERRDFGLLGGDFVLISLATLQKASDFGEIDEV